MINKRTTGKVPGCADLCKKCAKAIERIERKPGKAKRLRAKLKHLQLFYDQSMAQAAELERESDCEG